MFPELQDYSLIFVSLAVFGFIVLDIFKTGQYYGIPNFYKSSVEKIFHYISTAILVLSFTLVLMGLFISAPDQENAITIFIKEFFSIVDKIHELGILTDENYIVLVKIFTFAFLLAFMYIILYGVVFYLGVYFQIISAIKLNVFVKGNPSEAKTFSSLITESDDFFFFKKNEGINLWEAIRKDDVARFETIKGRSRLENWMLNLIKWLLNQIKRLDKKTNSK